MMINQIENYIRDESNQRKINELFVSIVLVLVMANVLVKAYNVLPKYPLFYFTSDAVEIGISCLIGVVLYYKILRKEGLRYRFLCLVLIIILLIGLAFLKDYRREMELETVFAEFMSYIGMTFIFGSLFYFFDNLNLFINNSYVKTKRALEVAESRLLRERFNPHFLFNAFNSLYSLSLQSHPETSDSILLLSGMMRYMTDEVEASKVLLKHEFKFIEDYIKIEKIRFGQTADIIFEYGGGSPEKLIEPLILITLVENAFKHGFYTNDPGAFIHVNATVVGDRLDFVVKNSISLKQHFQKEQREGKGLELLRQRLNLSYPNGANLKIEERDGIFSAVLNLTLK